MHAVRQAHRCFTPCPSIPNFSFMPKCFSLLNSDPSCLTELHFIPPLPLLLLQLEMTAIATATATATVFIFVIGTTTASPIIGLNSFLAHQARVDPLASNDSFLSLPSSVKKSLTLLHSRPHIPSLISSLLSFTLSFSVNVRLVGNFPSNSDSLLLSYLSASQPSNHFHVISPSQLKNHRLAIRHGLHLDVSHSPSLASVLSDTIKSEIIKGLSYPRLPLLPIPYTSVDKIISHEFEKEKPVEGVYLYLLNLGSQAWRYAYSYDPGDSSPEFSWCLGSYFTGTERYVWIDLNAGPVHYGPAYNGDGVLPRGEFHPLGVLHGRPKSGKALLADLASLIWSAYQAFLVPSLRIPAPYENPLVVRFIHVYGFGGKESYGLDWELIEKKFRDEVDDNGLLLRGQSLSFKAYEIKYSDCPICSFAISRSLNSRTSRFLFHDSTITVGEYLDSKLLHQILSESTKEFRKAASVLEEDLGRTIPVYVFDLDCNTTVLLDQFHQSVAFRDMVIAVRTKNPLIVSGYSCNDHPVYTNTRDLERPLVGSILQSMWGVSPTHLSWSPRHNNTLVDYTWSIGRTPFGPFSKLSSLSFVQKDAARRNVLLTTLNYSISSGIDVLHYIETYGGGGDLLKQKEYVQFIQRWNLFKYKLDKVASALSNLNFEMAFFYLRSSDHDLDAIHSIVYHASQEIEASLVCFRDPPFPWGSVSLSVGAFFLFFVYSRRDELRRSKRYQF